MRRLLKISALLLIFAFGNAAVPAHAEDSPYQLVKNAQVVLESFLKDSTYSGTRKRLDESRAVIIVPNFYRAGFLFGGAGGAGVMLAKNPDGTWTSPAFVNIGAASIGLQVGFSAAELLIFVNNDRALVNIANSNLRVGGNASLAVATLGGEVGASSGVGAENDYTAYSRAVGLYGSLSLEGASLEVRGDLTEKYYGRPAGLESILVYNKFSNPASLPLQQALQGTTHELTYGSFSTPAATPTTTPVQQQNIPPANNAAPIPSNNGNYSAEPTPLVQEPTMTR
jgi:lipid-binding SYLF domain-containing protein